MNSKNEKIVVLSETGNTREECIEKIQKNYGSNYQLDGYETKYRNGFMGIGGKNYVEQKFHLLYSEKELENSNVYVPKPDYSSSYANVAYDNESFMKNKKDFMDKIDTSLQMSAVSKQLSQLTTQLSSLVSNSASTVEHQNVIRIEQLLEDNGFTKSYIKSIKEKINDNFTLSELEDYTKVQNKVLQWIGEGLQIKKADFTRKPKVVIIIGPTGVGKTTTIAKMAAKITVDAKKNKQILTKPRIRMITTDTMRVGAQEQLEHWAEIIEVKVEKAEVSEHLEILYGNYADNSDFIFIDTAGYSPNDYENIARMRKIFDVKNMNESMFLAVTAGTNPKDLENIFRNFEAFNFKSVIVTKCDETSNFGGVISTLTEKHKDVSFVTTGQDVLNTIHQAHPMFFLKKLNGFVLDEKELEEIFGKYEE